MEEKQTNYVLMVKDLRVSYAQEEGGLFHPKKDLDVLKGVSFSIREGESWGWWAKAAAENPRFPRRCWA